MRLTVIDMFLYLKYLAVIRVFIKNFLELFDQRWLFHGWVDRSIIFWPVTAVVIVTRFHANIVLRLKMLNRKINFVMLYIFYKITNSHCYCFAAKDTRLLIRYTRHAIIYIKGYRIKTIKRQTKHEYKEHNLIPTRSYIIT